LISKNELNKINLEKKKSFWETKYSNTLILYLNKLLIFKSKLPLKYKYKSVYKPEKQIMCKE